jgi:hypothetical protein
VVVVFYVDIHRYTKIFYWTRFMDFGIECVTVCVCDWVLFEFLIFTVFMPLLMFLIIGIIGDGCN